MDALDSVFSVLVTSWYSAWTEITEENYNHGAKKKKYIWTYTQMVKSWALEYWHKTGTVMVRNFDAVNQISNN